MTDVKSIHLLRHAKSSWKEPGLSDLERPLNKRGRDAAKRIADHLRESGAAPDLALCSPAQRARETLEALISAIGPFEVRFDEAIYGASAPTLLEMLRALRDEVSSVLVVGHNPGLHELALDLAGGGNAEALRRLREAYPTGALAELVSKRPWPELATGNAELSFLVEPRLLGTS